MFGSVVEVYSFSSLRDTPGRETHEENDTTLTHRHKQTHENLPPHGFWGEITN